MHDNRIVTKPSWLDRQSFDELVRRYGGVPRCEKTGETEELSVDHIVPRWAGGTDDVSNLQFLTARLNAKKGIRPDSHWSQQFYWDQTPNLDALRGAQRLLFDEITRRSDWFGRPISQIARNLYLNGWVVGSGKTLGIPVGALALNHVIRLRWGAAVRADRVLVVTKEQAVRDQIAADLARDIPGYGILTRPPRVGVVRHGWQFEQTGWLDEHDVLVTCVQQIWERDGGTPRHDLAKVLAEFPMIAFDEPHFAYQRVDQLVELASTSVCFGFTGTPIDSTGRLLGRMVGLTTYGYHEADRTDHSMRLLDNHPDRFREFVREIGITEAHLIEHGERTTTEDPDREGYGKNIEPAKSVVRAVIDEMKRGDQLVIASETIAPHRDARTMTMSESPYPSHGLVACDSVATADALCENTNQMFSRDIVTYPPGEGWRAEVVHTDSQDSRGRSIPAKPLRSDHPWLRAKKQGYRVDAHCARLLFVVGIGREGVNNPACGPVGIAGPKGSVVEIVQRAIGRQLRALVTERAGRLVVPPAPLDTVRIITHRAFGNSATIALAIDFVCEMEDHLGALPGIDQIEASDRPSPEKLDRELTLPTKDKLAIAGALGDVDDHGEPVDAETVIRDFTGLDAGPRADRVREWATKVRDDPHAARREVRLHIDIEPQLIVTREQVKHEPSDADLERHLKIHNPHLVDKYVPIPVDHRDLVETLYSEHARQFHLPPLTSADSIEGIRRNLTGRVLTHLGRHYTGDRQRVHQLVGGAVKRKLCVPDGESASNDSDWDTPQVHAVLRRSDVQGEITGWIVGRLIDEGLCPTLAALRTPVDEDLR